MTTGHDVGANLKRIRDEAGLSQEDLMELAGVHRTQISEYERGERVPKLSTLERFSRALDVPLGEFLATR
jgi:transcriptional regulator with XRE-family HTH domain